MLFRVFLPCALMWGLSTFGNASPDKGVTTPTAILIPTISPNDPPAAILYTRPGMDMPDPSKPFNPDSYEYYHVHIAAWRDGRIVWSQNLSKGGKPYYSGKINPKAVQKILDTFGKEQARNPISRFSHAIPDAASQNIVIQGKPGNPDVSLQAVHFGNKPNSRIKFSSHGITSADAVIPNTPDEQEYQKFRTAFDRTGNALLSLAPTTTTAIARPLKFETVRLP